MLIFNSSLSLRQHIGFIYLKIIHLLMETNGPHLQHH